MYASLDNFVPTGKILATNVLDTWLLSKTNRLTSEVTKALEKYDISESARLLSEYIDELSNWYIRRSRKRFWKSENDTDKYEAYETLYCALNTYVKLLAPFMPFLTEEIYQGLRIDKKTPLSIHLCEWPKGDDKKVSDGVEKEMDIAKKIVEAGLSARNEKGIKVRQPLSKMTVTSEVAKLSRQLIDIISEEVNIKTLVLKKGSRFGAKLDTKISKELRTEGIARDFIRLIQDGRKKAGFNVEDRINTTWESDDKGIREALEAQAGYIAKETLSVEFSEKRAKSTHEETAKLADSSVWFGISKNK
jgi:isoleucyl-tRNA synthetase